MSVAAFGACTHLPLADCPFTRSALTVADAAEDAQVVATRMRWDVRDANLLWNPEHDFDVGPRMRTAEIEPQAQVAELLDDEPPALELPGTFWQRLAWLRQGGSY